jgi:glutamate synthase (NADPH/NADH) small chain
VITDLGVEINYNTEVGKDISLQELADTHDVVVLAAGCQTPQELGIPARSSTGSFPD